MIMPLTPYEIRRRQELTTKMQNYNITIAEAEELKQLLEKERSEAQTGGDIVAVIAIGALILLILAFLSKKK